jgi:2-succinyl-5-enolpyruvyl-6-hydroxy-3-cyclohexene-1-carboxylate synthase
MQHNQHIAELGPLFEGLGLKHVVICPGSRNAPLIQLFTSNKFFSCQSIVDERSAGYVAMGMARELGKPVLVVTTSGTAVLNLAPAVAEAYQQRIPLIVMTADRPLESIPQFNNQWLDQEAPFYAHSKGFFQLPVNDRHPEDLERMLYHVQRLLDSASDFPRGPVHLNVPLEEPLYETLPKPIMERRVEKLISGSPEINESQILQVPEDHRILVLAGMGSPNKTLQDSLLRLIGSRQAVVVAENIANLPREEFISHPELCIAWSDEKERETLKPDLVISFGGQVVSKRLKLLLQGPDRPKHIEIEENAAVVLDDLANQHPLSENNTNKFQELWYGIEKRVFTMAQKRFEALPFSNLSAIQSIIDVAPAQSVLHLGNSSSIRYSQVASMRSDLRYFSNRGTSGIDGCVSAAVGAAMVSDKIHILVVGDLSFAYDSNAMWNKDFPGNLKIIVINDGGGGIFRLLDGPEHMDFFEEYQVTHHPVSIELLAQSYGRVTRRAENEMELRAGLEALLSAEGNISLLEVDTSGSENSRIFKGFLDINQ